MSSRLKTLERERQRLERLLRQNPQWRAMVAAGCQPELVDGVWEFPGLNRVQASSLRQSLVFQAYQEVLAAIDHALSPAVIGRERAANDASAQESVSGAKVTLGDAHSEEAQPVSGLGGEGAAADDVRTPVAVSEPPPGAFRTKIKIKPLGQTAPTGIAAPPAATLDAGDDGHPSGAASASAEAPALTAVPQPEKGSPADLTRIRSINRALAARLAEAGITSFAEIAHWDARAVRDVARRLDLGKRIWRENWIEQAALIVLKEAPGSAVGEGEPPIALAGGPEPEVEADSLHAPDEVVDTDVAAGPAGAGVVAPITLGEVAAEPEPEATLEAEPDPEPEAKPAERPPLVVVADRPAVGDEVPDDAAPAAEMNRVPAGHAEAAGAEGGGGERGQPADADVDAEPDRVPEPAGAVREPVRAVRTGAGRWWGAHHKAGRRVKRLPAPSLRRLTYIRGLNTDAADQLRSAGVRSIGDIAQWTEADVRWFSAVLGDTARISADQWIEQAVILMNGHWTRYALRLVAGDYANVVARPRRRTVVRWSPVAPAGTSGASGEDVQPDAVAERRADMPAATAAPVDREVAEREPAEQRDKRPPSSVALRPELIRRGPQGAPVRAGRAFRPAIGPAGGAPIDVILRGLGRSPQAATPPVEHEDPVSVGVEGEPETEAATSAGSDPVTSAAVARRGEPAAVDAREPSDGASGDGAALDVGHPAEPDESEVGMAHVESFDGGAQLNSEDAGGRFGADNAGLGETAALPDAVEGPDAAAVVDRAPGGSRREVSDFGASDRADEDEADRGFGDEAAVRIVSRRRGAGPDGASEATATMPVAPDDPPSRSRLGYSPDFIARRMHEADEPDEAGDADHAAYHDAVEEATVTIIRAKGQEEPAAGVVPCEIANDQPARAENEEEPKKRSFGSRFLKALTGE